MRDPTGSGPACRSGWRAHSPAPRTRSGALIAPRRSSVRVRLAPSLEGLASTRTKRLWSVRDPRHDRASARPRGRSSRPGRRLGRATRRHRRRAGAAGGRRRRRDRDARIPAAGDRRSEVRRRRRRLAPRGAARGLHPRDLQGPGRCARRPHHRGPPCRAQHPRARCRHDRGCDRDRAAVAPDHLATGGDRRRRPGRTRAATRDLASRRRRAVALRAARPRCRRRRRRARRPPAGGRPERRRARPGAAVRRAAPGPGRRRARPLGAEARPRAAHRAQRARRIAVSLVDDEREHRVEPRGHARPRPLRAGRRARRPLSVRPPRRLHLQRHARTRPGRFARRGRAASRESC